MPSSAGLKQVEQDMPREALLGRIAGHFAASAELQRSAAAELAAPIARAVELMVAALRSGGKVLACGNGGSAADAQHFAAELLNRFERERPPLAGLALTTDSSTLTSVANDYRFEDVFAKQLQALGRAGDVLLAISTSGNSANVVAAVHAAHALGVRVVALTGNGGGKVAARLDPADAHICVPHGRTMRIQEVHVLTLHCLCDGIDALMFGDRQ